MCWSLEASVLGWIGITAVTAYVARRNCGTDRWAALLFLYVGQVQLGEAAVWADQPCGRWNRSASLALFALVLLQPLVNCALAWHYHGAGVAKAALRLLAAATAAGVAVLGAAAAPRSWAQLCSRPCEGEGHLRWGWAVNVRDWMRLLFLLVVCAPFLAMRPLRHGAVYITYIAGFFAFAMLRYATAGTFESMWCWFGFFGGLLPLVLNPGSLRRGTTPLGQRKAA